MMPALAQAERRPEPETLEAREIERLFVALRDEREALMRDLRDLQLRAVASAPGPDAFIDLMEGRLALNALLAYWRRLLARMLRLETWAPLGSEAPCFADMRGDGRHRVARALVPLTPDSLLFVHGPVTLWHAAALAEQMLEPGDRLTRLAKGAFHRELTLEPRIIVWDGALGASPIDYDGDAVAVNGMFGSAAGREFAFVALPDAGHVPERRAGWHPVTANIIATRPARSAQPAAFDHKLTIDCCPGAGTIARGSSVLLAKAEAFLAAITQHILVGERVLLLSRVPSFTIDPDFGAWLATSPELQFEIDWARQKPIPGRGAFVPVRYRVLPAEAQWQRSMFVCLDSHLDF
ncbi:MAG: hypothetical protein WDN44_16030 [Sphingomonas sp.]